MEPQLNDAATPRAYVAASSTSKSSSPLPSRRSLRDSSAKSSAGKTLAKSRGRNPQGRKKASGKTKKKVGKHQKPAGKLFNAIIVLCLFAGIAIMAYPVFATVEMNRSQYEISEKMRKEVFHDFTAEQIEAKLKKAEQYNYTLKYGPILDPFLQRVAPDTPVYEEYLKELDFGGPMATIRIPKIDVYMPIYHGTYDDVLDKGVGHLFGSSLPVGGKNTHAVLTAHSGLGNATMFDNIPKLVKGDEIFISVGNRNLKYTVTSTQIIEPTDVDSLYIEDGRDMITLITCYPYGINSHRYLVHADRAELTANDEKTVSEPPSFQWFKTWMIWPVLVSVASLLLVFWPRKRRKKKGKKAATAKAVVVAASEAIPSEAPASGSDSSEASASDTVNASESGTSKVVESSAAVDRAIMMAKRRVRGSGRRARRDSSEDKQ